MPKISRPKLPKGYVDKPISEVSWEHVEERLTASINYWLCTVYPDGRPHVVPRWGAFLDGKLYYDGSPETRHARNLEKNSSRGPPRSRSTVLVRAATNCARRKTAVHSSVDRAHKSATPYRFSAIPLALNQSSRFR